MASPLKSPRVAGKISEVPREQWGRLGEMLEPLSAASVKEQAAERPETLKILESLHRKCDRYLRLQLLTGDHIERAEAEHRQLIELCRKRDKMAAKSLTEEHIVGLEQDIAAALSGT